MVVNLKRHANNQNAKCANQTSQQQWECKATNECVFKDRQINTEMYYGDVETSTLSAFNKEISR